MNQNNEQVMAIQSEINACKQILAGTDYKALKHADGVLTDAEYKETKEQRQALRDKINELEAQLLALDETATVEEA